MKSVMLLAAVPALVGAAEPIRLQPASTWVLDYADNSCRLLRQFGDSKTPSTLLLEQASPGASMSMVVISDSLGKLDEIEPVTARFLPGELAYTGGLPTKAVKSNVPAVMWTSVGFLPLLTIKLEKLSKAEMKALRSRSSPQPRDLQKLESERAEVLATAQKVTSIQIDTKPHRSVTLETGSMGHPISMMRDCTRNLVRSWGLDPDVQDRIVRPARKKTPAFNWFTSEDYPQNALHNHEQSVVIARVLIDAAGKISNCTSLSHYDAPEFQKTVCRVISKRGRYEPAEAADGTKVPSYDTVTIRFVLYGNSLR